MSTTGGTPPGGTGMEPSPAPERQRMRRSIVGPLVLIGLGVIFLLGTLRPNFDPWWILWRYWPLLLIFIGLGQIWDHYWSRSTDGNRAAISGTGLAFIVLLIILIVVGLRGTQPASSSGWVWDHPWNEHSWNSAYMQHETQSIGLQGAKRVSANINIPAGSLTVSGGSAALLDASFDYDNRDGKPNIDYSVSDGEGQLNIAQNGGGDTHWGGHENDWNLQFASGIPINLQLNMGAGQGNLRVKNVDLSNLEVHMGVGDLNLDLTGPRSKDLDATIQGGVGSARVLLPKDVGVRVQASGGLGSINANGLQRDGDAYINTAYGKTPATINLTIEGGIGQINLNEE